MTTVDWSQIAVDFGTDPINVGDLTSFANDLAYQGLDPALILKMVSERGGATWKEDVKYIIVFALTRGNKIQKASAKMSASGAKRMAELVARYQLKENASDRTAITPVRVAQCLPTWTCAAAAALGAFLPVGPATMSVRSVGYPPEMMCMAFGSLIPNDQSISPAVRQELTEAYSLWQDQFTRTINTTLRTESKQKVNDSFKDPLMAAINSTFFPNKVRREWLIKRGILAPDGSVSGAVAAAAAAYRNL